MRMRFKSISRRTFLAGLAAGASLGRAQSASPRFGLGVASYSLRKFSRMDAIRMIRQLGTKYVNVKSFHLPYDSAREELIQARRDFERAGLSIVGGGTVSLQKDDDEDIRRYFEYAKLCRMPLMVIAPTPRTLPRIERFVKEYDIRVAVHNHGPEDPYFSSPSKALEAVQNRDERVGLCIDVGHTARTGADVVQEVSTAGPRLLDMHMKDLRSFSDAASQCPVGEGKMPVEAVFRQLARMNYTGFVNLEYEIEPENPLPGMKKSFAFMRQALQLVAAES